MGKRSRAGQIITELFMNFQNAIPQTFTKILKVVSFVSLATSSLAAPVDESLPMVGTDLHGHTYPGATVPFGMVQLSPDTRTLTWDGCAGYHYTDSTIQGFSHTHLSGTGCGALGDVLLMPTVGAIHFNAGSPGNGYASGFSHAQEVATPGYYRVYLETPQVTAELTATERCGFHKYTFPASDQSHIILDLVHGIGNEPVGAALRVENQETVSGCRLSKGWGGERAIYFVMQFSKPFESAMVQPDSQTLTNAPEGKGTNVKASFNFKTSADEVVLVKVGISGTSIEGARKNLAAEIHGWDFDKVRSAAVQQWRNVFDAVQIKTFDPHVARTFHANLYLSCLAPVLFNDVDGAYRGYDHKNHVAANFQNYTTFSIWDIYRAEWPLLTLLQPGRINDVVQSLMTEYPQTGRHSTPIWPIWGNETWCMIGYHSVDMIAEAYLEGFRGFDPHLAFQQMRDTALQDRNGLDPYKRYGYMVSVPNEKATSHTLEYTVDDWCIAKMAEALGHQEDASMFYKRAANYYHIFDKTTGFFRGRYADGSWRSPFNPIGLVNDEYVEADAWQYRFALQQDVPGMIALFGGGQQFVGQLDSLFTADSKVDSGDPDISGLIGQYSQGDEQCHHVAYLYDYAGQPYKTQQRVRQIMAQLYADTPAGQCGNADCGQMSAWYVFSALGFYPVNPASGVYAIGSPIVSKAVIHLDQDKYHGHTFTVVANHNSAENIYIQSAALNNQPLTKPWLTRDQITSGGILKLEMGPKPNPDWGSAPADRPPATMPADFQYPRLPKPSSTNLVVLPLPIRVLCGAHEPAGDFVPIPNMVAGGTAHADVKIDASAANAAPSAVYQSESYGKDIICTFPVPVGKAYLVRLHFAELFDRTAGYRLENIAINGQPLLTNFDILTAAGGMNKAVVREFPDVTPNPQGNIVIRIAASPASPDKNAKISGIEILKPESAAPNASQDQLKIK
jgi:predicted alpha-1,2-mannosidase